MADIETKNGTTRESAGTKGTKRAAKRAPRPRLATNSRMVPPASRPKRRMVAVTSGKGGVGKTNIVTNLALALARQGTRVLVVDGDLGLANVDLLLGVAPQYDLQDVILGQRSIRDVVFEGPDGIQVLPASSGVEELANLDEFRTECLIRSLSELENDVDIILIDSPSGIGRNAISMVQAADQILVVTTPEPTSFSDAYAMIKVLSRHPIKCVPSLLVNQANSEEEALSVARRVRTVAKRFLNLDVEYWGCVLDDESVAKSVQRQEPFLSTYPYSPAASCIYSLARRILGQEPKPAPPNAGPTNAVSRDEVPEGV
ncbi:MAG: MinD/ParA family protein [Candidatus Eisenbacteria bacterium]